MISVEQLAQDSPLFGALDEAQQQALHQELYALARVGIEMALKRRAAAKKKAAAEKKAEAETEGGKS